MGRDFYSSIKKEVPSTMGNDIPLFLLMFSSFVCLIYIIVRRYQTYKREGCFKYNFELGVTSS